MKNTFKRVAVIAIMFVLATSVVFAAGKSRKQIDSFMKEYEKFVVKVEKMNPNDTMALMSLNVDAAKLSKKADELQDTSDWNDNDTIKYTELSNRYAKALSKLQ